MQVMSVSRIPSHPKTQYAVRRQEKVPNPKFEKTRRKKRRKRGLRGASESDKVQVVSLSFVQSREKQKPVQARVERRAAHDAEEKPQEETVNPVPHWNGARDRVTKKI